MRSISLEQLRAELQAQGVPREHKAMKCPVCGTVQSAADLIAAGAGDTVEEGESFFGHSCVGRFTNAGPWKGGEAGGRGCDWTLGGFLQLHKLEVTLEEGETHPVFEPATPAEAQAHMHRQVGPR